MQKSYIGRTLDEEDSNRYKISRETPRERKRGRIKGTAKTYSARRRQAGASGRRRRKKRRAALSQSGIQASTAQTFARDSGIRFCLGATRIRSEGSSGEEGKALAIFWSGPKKRPKIHTGRERVWGIWVAEKEAECW